MFTEDELISKERGIMRFQGRIIRGTRSGGCERWFSDHKSTFFIFIDGGTDPETSPDLADWLLVTAKSSMEKHRPKWQNLKITLPEAGAKPLEPIAAEIMRETIEEAVAYGNFGSARIGKAIRLTLVFVYEHSVGFAHLGSGRIVLKRAGTGTQKLLAAPIETNSAMLIQPRPLVGLETLNWNDLIFITSDGLENSPGVSQSLQDTKWENIRRFLDKISLTPMQEDRTAFVLKMEPYPRSDEKRSLPETTSQVLSQSPFFFDLTAADSGHLMEIAKLARFSPGEFVMKEGDLSGSLYILLSGKVKILARDGNVFFRDHPGESIGELSFIDGQPRSASVVAHTQVDFLKFDKSALNAFIKKHPVAGVSILQAIANVSVGRFRDYERTVLQRVILAPRIIKASRRRSKVGGAFLKLLKNR